MPKKKATKKRASRVPLTRNMNTWTESQFWGRIRSHLRRFSVWWKPRLEAKKAARRKSESENKRLRWEYQCQECKGWFPDKMVELDHIVPCGTLRSFDDVPGFLGRMLCGVQGFRVVCKGCHNQITHGEKPVN